MRKIISSIISVLVVLSLATSVFAFSAISLKSISLDKKKITLDVGKTYVLRVTLNPLNTTQKLIKYSTSNKYIANVDSKGKIIALKPGKVIITVSSNINKQITSKCEVIVTQTNSANSKPQEPTKISIMLWAQQNWLTEDDIVKELQKKTNTIIKVEIPAFNTYMEKLKLLLAAGERLPDIIDGTAPNTSDFTALKDSGAVIPITKYFNESKYLKNLISETNLKVSTIKGQVIGYPRESFVFAHGFMLRKDWLKKVNLDIGDEGKPLTVEKFTEILKAFTFNDPDGNGKNDTYGFDTPVPLDGDFAGYPPAPIKAAFNSGKGWMKDKNGSLTFTDLTTEWDNYKKALSFYKSMIDQKIVNPDLFLSKQEVLRDNFYKGKVGMVCAFGSGQSYVNFLPPMKAVNPNAELTYFTGLKGVDGNFKVYRSGVANNNYHYVTKYAKNPKVCVELLDYMASPQGQLLLYAGLEGKHYTLENGIPMRKTEVQKNNYSDYRKWYLATTMIRDPKRWDYYWDIPNMGEEGKKIENWMNFSISPQAVVVNEDLGYRTSAMSDMVDMNKDLQQTLIKYLTGAIKADELDAARNKYISSDLFKKHTQEMNEWYKNR